MDQIKELQTELSNMAQASPEFCKVCQKAGIEPGLAIIGGGVVFLLLGVYLQGYNIVLALVTCVYPMWKSILTIEDDDEEETNTWLCYWTVFGIVQIVELLVGFILNYVPYYSIIRLLFFIYLMAPMTKGAKTMYTSVFQPLLKQHKASIEKFFDSLADQTEAMAAQAKQAAQEGVQNIDLNKVAAGVNAAQNMAGDKKSD